MRWNARLIMKKIPPLLTLLCALLAGFLWLSRAWKSGSKDETHGLMPVGVAKLDITPDYPIRLNGFGFRRDESEGIQQRIFAKALAFGGDDPAVLITLDSLGIPLKMTEEVAARLEKKAKLKRARLAVAFSHSHTTPKVNGASDTIFSTPIPPEHQARIDRYARELTDHLEAVALHALADRRPAKLAWAVGKVGFAMNRRTPGGPVDHDLPMLLVSEPDGRKRAIYVSYACHCVTLSQNKISGDWAGFAQEAMEKEFPGAVALVSIGCGSDSNPNSGVTGDKVELAEAQGRQIMEEARRLLHGPLRPLSGPIAASWNIIHLPLNQPPTKEAIDEMAKKDDPLGYNARWQLAKLGRREALQDHIPYGIGVWTFGEDLAMVFLAGEVCVDYSLRLKSELDRERIWLTAYANDFCSYIPSERLVLEGGYGGGAEIPYFALPNTLKAGLEDAIVKEARRQVPGSFVVKAKP